MGSGRQYNGRRGKVDNCIVGVFLSCVDASCQYPPGLMANSSWWKLVQWAWAERPGRVPDDREFQTKLTLGWQMIQRVHAEGFPFVAVAWTATRTQRLVS
ncbi:MAG: transposase [Anaerolineaceae bacterium]|nr:transposase [Anaerolineaceae bacterium]